MLFFFLDNQWSLEGSDNGLKVSGIRKRISERVLKGRDERKNVVDEFEERISLVSLLCCEYLLSNDEKKNEFMRDVVFPLSPSLLDIPHGTPQSDETELCLSHLISLLRECCFEHTYRSLVCCKAGRLQFGRILSVWNERVLDQTRITSCLLLQALFQFGGEREVKWMLKEGGVLAVIRGVSEKVERNGHVMCHACYIVAQFLCFSPYSIRCLREEWKGKTEWREMLWMMAEEGGVDSVCGRTKADDWGYAKQVLRELGICCHE
jgi:hypothetical protein